MLAGGLAAKVGNVAGAGKAYALLYAHTPRGIVQEVQPRQYSHTTPWTKTTLEMDVPADASLVWAWFCHDAPRPGIVHWDDCSVEVIGKAKGPGRQPRPNQLLSQKPGLSTDTKTKP